MTLTILSSTNSSVQIGRMTRLPSYSLDHASQPPKQMIGFDLPGRSRVPDDMQIDLSGGVELEQLALHASSGSSHDLPDYFNCVLF